MSESDSSEIKESIEADSVPIPGVSPYATGGGGVTFERKVAVWYLARLLVGDTAPELGDGRCVVSVAFQQAPDFTSDDLVVRAATEDETEASLVLAIAVRRKPSITESDTLAQKLITNFVKDLVNIPPQGPELRFGLVVAGSQPHAVELAELADLARAQHEAEKFFRLVYTPQKFRRDLVARLTALEALVANALDDTGVAAASDTAVRQRAWELLTRLYVRMPCLESPDETDWCDVRNSLVNVARDLNAAGAGRLRDRLATLASEYAPKAADVDLSLLRRDAHEALDASVRRYKQGWATLAHLKNGAVAAVRAEIESSDGSRCLHLERDELSHGLLITATSGGAVLVHGESGVGKSALVISTLTNAEAVAPKATQAIIINLRHLPGTTLELEGHLGVPLATLLAELSAPTRLLVIDGADAAAEGKGELLRYVNEGARKAGVGVVVVCAKDSKEAVKRVLDETFRGHVAEFPIAGLNDEQLDEVVATFKELSGLAANPRSRELLRRPVVVDLLVRGGLSGVPLSDADAMQQVWARLVRRNERSDRGSPSAREIAMLKLASYELVRGDALAVLASIDPASLDGLRQDGVLRKASDNPFSVVPEFAHDELRRYAIAWYLLAEGRDVVARLRASAVPRWSLGAARLACQALLSEGDCGANPLRGRLAKLQAAFDALVGEGYGDRWGDVPGEALLTLGDSERVLRDAWADVRGVERTVLFRLCRLVDQRLKDSDGFVRIPAVEPLIALLLDNAEPWAIGEPVENLLREWLRALVVANTSPGHSLRVRLRERIIEACIRADRADMDFSEADAPPHEDKPPDINAGVCQRAPCTTGGQGETPRRPRRTIPHEITDEIIVEMLALLGPDLGDGGEAILRRIAWDAPSWLAPAVEELCTGKALAAYRPGFLAEMTAAYYLSDQKDDWDYLDDGIRGHHSRSLGVTPLYAWYRGPFFSLLDSDFRGGVAVLNRMLNHAARFRAKTLAYANALVRAGNGEESEESSVALDVDGMRRLYHGDSHVWLWYRGTGVGPPPCISGLQALERICDRILGAGVPLHTLVPILLDGCENLAMLGLVVGALLRHVENAGKLLDPFLAEPIAWESEFRRVVEESSGLAAPSDQIVAPSRRRWSLRDVAMFLCVRAEEDRAKELRALGVELVAKQRRRIEQALRNRSPHEPKATDAVIEDLLSSARLWATALDRDAYQTEPIEGGILVRRDPPVELVQAMEGRSRDSEREFTAMRLMGSYCYGSKKIAQAASDPSALVTDLKAAKLLYEDPPTTALGDSLDVPAAVAAYALESHLLRNVPLPDDLLSFAGEMLLQVATGGRGVREGEYEGTYCEWASDRSAARAIPLLLLPAAASLRALIDDADGAGAYERAVRGCECLAKAVADEVRVSLARGLDGVWSTPCIAQGRCHHEIALALATESIRDSALGEWDAEAQQRKAVRLTDPIEQTLSSVNEKDIRYSRLDCAIRVLSSAAVARSCVSSRARELLDVLLAAHRRALLAYEQEADSRGTHALVAARAILTVANKETASDVFAHIDAFANNTVLLGNFLRALAAAAEETPGRAETARRLWPGIVFHVIELHERGCTPFDERHHGEYTLASLIPTPTSDVAYLYRELQGEPIKWWAPLEWRSAIERWLSVAAGHPPCVEALILFLQVLSPIDQVRLGLPWVSTLVLSNPAQIAGRTRLIESWLIEMRTAADDAKVLPEWQTLVDALVVAGMDRLAPFAE